MQAVSIAGGAEALIRPIRSLANSQSSPFHMSTKHWEIAATLVLLFLHSAKLAASNKCLCILSLKRLRVKFWDLITLWFLLWVKVNCDDSCCPSSHLFESGIKSIMR